MLSSTTITVLKRLQEPEPWEPQITENTFNALEDAITAIETLEQIKKICNNVTYNKSKKAPTEKEFLFRDYGMTADEILNRISEAINLADRMNKIQLGDDLKSIIEILKSFWKVDD